MARISIDIPLGIPLVDDPRTGHNRWHWDIAPIAECAPGDELVLGTRDALDGQLGPSSTSDDIHAVETSRIHPLSDPVWVQGSEPGDLLEVEILEVRPAGYGFTSQRPGLGLLSGELNDPYLVHWSIDAGCARSEQLPGVTIKGSPFLGIIGVAPSAGLITESLERERLVGSDPVCANCAIPSTAAVAAEGLRTGPPRENGGNVDVKQLAAGSRILLPVWQQGALLSIGDAHFAQGDGEVCGTAIEMQSVSRIRVALHRQRVDLDSMPMPVIEHTTAVDSDASCVTVLGYPTPGEPDALKSAAANAIRNLCSRLAERYGFRFQAAYALCSVAADLRVAQVVNQPNVAVSATISSSVFDDKGKCLHDRSRY